MRTEVRERPILFSGAMVRAILEGRKTMTRRVAKMTSGGHLKEPGGHRRWHPGDPDAVAACPYGRPGDRLWVRETWAMRDDTEPGTEHAKRYLGYKADGGGFDPHDPMNWHSWSRWRPSIHMPRWASRLLLDVREVRVERVQDITEADAIAEGIKQAFCPHCGYTYLDCQIQADHRLCGHDTPESTRDAFAKLWDSINAKRGYGWESNPWVWVISFRRIET